MCLGHLNLPDTDRHIVKHFVKCLNGVNLHIDVESDDMQEGLFIFVVKLSKLAQICGVEKLQESMVRVFAHCLFERRDNLSTLDIVSL